MRHITKFLADLGLDCDFIFGLERHQERGELHAHGIIRAALDKEQRRIFQEMWWLQHGTCRALPVLDGCMSYVTKYALKGDSEFWDWRLS